MTETQTTPRSVILGLSVISGILLGFCTLLGAKIYHGAPVDSYPELVGTSMPEVMLQRLDGTPISTHVFKGKAHVVLFAAARCSYCDQVYPVLKDVAAVMPVLMIARSRELMQVKADEEGFTFPVACDSLSVVYDSLGLLGTPTTLLVNEHGLIEETVGGGGKSIERILRYAQAALAKEG